VSLNTATLVYDYSTPPVIPPQLLPENDEIGETCGTAEWQAWALRAVADAGQDVGTHTERLCEIAGRACYDSFARGRPSAAYHKHLVDVNHGCFDGETEVLTARGWVAWEDVVESDQFCSMHPQTHQIEYARATKLHRYVHTGRMYRVAGSNVDLLVTPNHRMLVMPTTTKEGRARNAPWELVEAKDLERSYAVVKSGKWDAPDCAGITAPIACLLGFAIGDGCIGPRARPVRFRLRRERKIRFLYAQAAAAGWDLDELANDTYVLRVPDSHRALFDAMYDDDGEKVIPPGVLLGWSRAQLLALYDGLINSDGSVSETGVCYDTKSRMLSGQFQQLALHIGLASDISMADSYLERERPLYRNNVIRRSLMPEINRFAGSTTVGSWEEGWEGEVFCATVPNGTLYVRRNGKAVWTGNSVHEHFVFTVQVKVPSRHMYVEILESVLNRPGVFVLLVDEFTLRTTVNIRSAREWAALLPPVVPLAVQHVADCIAHEAHLLAPQIAEAVKLCIHSDDGMPHVSRVTLLEHDEERWVSLFLTGSRGFSHELVRHKFRTAVSQRSTRYVDESASQWVDHPLILAYAKTEEVQRAPNGEQTALTLMQRVNHVKDEAKRAYRAAVQTLEPWLIAKGVEKFTARKQARGAARGYLGNALYTECVFSASVAQWKRMLRQRANIAADAEIREVFCGALRVLQGCAFGAQFQSFKLTPSPDGIGEVAVEG
jgi:hypothetical protein